MQFERNGEPDKPSTDLPNSTTLESIEADRTSDTSKAPSSTEGDVIVAPPSHDEHCNREHEKRMFDTRLKHELFGRNRHR